MLRCLTSMETESFVVIKHRLNSALNLNHGISEQHCVHHHKQHEAKYTLKTLNRDKFLFFSPFLSWDIFFTLSWKW